MHSGLVNNRRTRLLLHHTILQFHQGTNLNPLRVLPISASSIHHDFNFDIFVWI